MEKLLLHIPAAILAAGAVANLPDTSPLDPDIEDNETKLRNLYAWELHRIFYHGLMGTLTSKDWPTPTLNVAPLVGQLGPLVSAGLNALLKDSGPFGVLVQQLIKSIPVPAPQSTPKVDPVSVELK